MAKEYNIELKNFLVNLKTVIRDSKAFSTQFLLDNSDEIEEYNRQNLRRGQNNDNTKIVPPYTEFTKKIKRQKGQVTSLVNFRDTGEFYESIEFRFTKPKGESFAVYSENYKVESLINRQGNDNFLGINQKNIDTLELKLSNFLTNKIKSKWNF